MLCTVVPSWLALASQGLKLAATNPCLLTNSWPDRIRQKKCLRRIMFGCHEFADRPRCLHFSTTGFMCTVQPAQVEITLENSIDALGEINGDLPSLYQLVSVLHKCKERKDLFYVKDAHVHICSNGLDALAAVGNFIVPVLLECGSTFDAQNVFNKLRYRNSYSWSSVISGCIQCGQYLHALNLYPIMQEVGVFPDTHLLVGLLQACAKLKKLETGQDIHVETAQKGLEKDPYVGSVLVDMYVKCGMLLEAGMVLDALPARNVVSWNALIAGYAEFGPPAKALACFRQMKSEGICADAATFVCIFKAFKSPEAADKVGELHTEILQSGLDGDLFIGNTLVDIYAKCGLFAEAQNVFVKLPVRDVVSWTALVAGYAEHGPWQEVLRCFDQMEVEGVLVDAAMFASALKSYKSKEAVEDGFEVHRKTVEKGCDKQLVVGNALIVMYVNCGLLIEARQVLERLPPRDVVSWNSLIGGYAETGCTQEVLMCFEQMQLEGISQDAVTLINALKAWGNIRDVAKGRIIHMELVYRGFENELVINNCLVDMYSKCACFVEAQEVFDKQIHHDVISWNALIVGHLDHGFCQQVLDCYDHMQLQAVFPNNATFVCVLKACGTMGALHKGQEIHVEVKRKGLETDVLVGSSLVDMYSKCGSLKEAREVLENLPLRSVVSWTSLIVGYIAHGPDEEALKCFEQMQLEGIVPDVEVFACVLKACGNIGALQVGQELHKELVEKGFEKDIFVGSTLVDLYAKHGLLIEAWKVLEKLPAQNVVSWSAMIQGCGMNHNDGMMLQYFRDMQENGVNPDAITFTCLLSACSRASLVLDGQEIFRRMSKEHGIVPTTDHITLMIDIFARSGNLIEAVKFVESMAGSPSEEMWMCLLCACKTCEETELGRKCFERLIQLSPEWSAPYIVMANIYASTARWGDVKTIEEMRKNAGAMKKLAVAVIEVNKEIHEFVVNSKQDKEILDMVEKISLHMEVAGYIPVVDLVLRSV